MRPVTFFAASAAFPISSRSNGEARPGNPSITPSRTGPRATAAAQTTRAAVNSWVLAQGPAHADGVFDFAAAVADPARSDRLESSYDAGDGLHLSAAGYRALAGAVQIDRLSGSPCLAGDTASSVTVSGGR